MISTALPPRRGRFFGLPDLTPLHAVYLDKMKSMMIEGLAPADFEKLARNWLPGMADGFEQWRQLFFNAGTGIKPPS